MILVPTKRLSNLAGLARVLLADPYHFQGVYASWKHPPIARIQRERHEAGLDSILVEHCHHMEINVVAVVHLFDSSGDVGVGWTVVEGDRDGEERKDHMGPVRQDSIMEYGLAWAQSNSRQCKLKPPATELSTKSSSLKMHPLII